MRRRKHPALRTSLRPPRSNDQPPVGVPARRVRHGPGDGGHLGGARSPTHLPPASGLPSSDSGSPEDLYKYIHYLTTNPL